MRTRILYLNTKEVMHIYPHLLQLMSLISPHLKETDELKFSVSKWTWLKTLLEIHEI